MFGRAAVAAAASAARISPSTAAFRRCKTTSAQYVEARHRDPTFEKLMDGYKHLLPVLSVVDLILASPDLSIPLTLLSSPGATRLLHLRRSPAHFLRSFPAVFSLRPHPTSSLPVIVSLTPAASRLAYLSSSSPAPLAADRIVRLLSLCPYRSLPLRAIFRIWRELGLPDDFEYSVIAANPSLFSLSDNPREPNTHLLSLAAPTPAANPTVDAWRCNLNPLKSDGEEEPQVRFAFKQSFPPGMRLTKGFRAHLKEWQRLPYPSPYNVVAASSRGQSGKRVMEKRAVAIAHEFLSLTVEKMVEVEKISHFRKSFGIELNIRDLFLDHPGIFYLSTKGRRHTVFLREAYDRGCLIESNQIYEARRKLLHLVLMRKKGAAFADAKEDMPLAESSDS